MYVIWKRKRKNLNNLMKTKDMAGCMPSKNGLEEEKNDIYHN